MLRACPAFGSSYVGSAEGVVVSDASDKTIVVRVDVVKLHPRYKKVVKRSTRFHAHDEENQAKLGDNLPIIPGMIAEVDIITGEKSILTYLLKPVLRAKARAFTER